MIQSKADFQFYLKEDLKRNLGVKKIGWVKFQKLLFWQENGALAYRFLKELRKVEYAHNCYYGKSWWGTLYYLWRLMIYTRIMSKYNIMFKLNTVGYGVYLPHPKGSGIIVNCFKVGNYATINKGVLIGNKHHNQEEQAVLGDYVELCPGSVVIGKIRVGDRVIVAPNSVVVKDVPDNAVVSGVPAKQLYL